MTMVMLTSLAMTRERERGTMENLLATPVRPSEVMVGKILPYVVMGYVQLGVILSAAFVLFEVPMVGSFTLLLAMIGVFIVANLGVGFTFSTIAKNQLQAMQMTFFFFLPSMLLSGFMFPFRAMPVWAQHVGEVLPLTHFLRIVRGILLKGNTFIQLWPELWPMLLFLFAAGALDSQVHGCQLPSLAQPGDPLHLHRHSLVPSPQLPRHWMDFTQPSPPTHCPMLT